jgi:hypothetical protein
MSKHTPGPWVLDQGVSSKVMLIDSKATNGAVGEIVDCRNPADARLIAAAPDLLEALKYVLEDDGLIPRATAKTRAVVHAAIAKATGESK